MDFHSFARRDLQAMCKKNKIPANLTNAAMADSLQSLKSIEWDEEIKQKLMPQSEKIEQHGSPLPRSRRVSVRSSDISGFSMGEMNDKEEEMKKEALIEGNQTPATAVRRSQRIQSAMSTRTRARTSTPAAGMGTCTAGTRTRKGKKEEAPAEAVDVVVVETPGPQRGRTKAVETPAHGVVPRSSARPTRQSTRRLAESPKGTRVTRTMTNMMALDPDDDKEAESVAEKVEAKKEETAVELKENIISDTAPEQEQEARTDVIELGGATEPKSADKLEVEEAADQNQVNEVSKETEQAEEQTEDVDLEKEDKLVSDEKLNLVEHNAEQMVAKSNEENIEGSDINAVMPLSEEKDEIIQEKSNNTDTDESEGSTQEELNSKTSEQKVASLLCDDHKDDVSVEKLVEEVTERASLLVASLLSDRNAAPISEEEGGQVAPEKDESEVNQTTLGDSPIMGLVSEVMQENNSDLQNAPSSDITLDAQDAPSGLCLSSPIRAPADEGVEKMLDSVVRHFANARLSSVTKMIDASVVQKEVTDKVVSDDESELVQNENADKERVDLKSMSLRKLKALYKDHLNEFNSKKVVDDDGKRLPLGKLDENLLA